MSAANATPEARADFVAAVAQALKDGGAGADVWEPFVERGLVLVGGQRDLRWARLVLLQDQFEPIRSGPVGGARWIGRDADAVAVARSQGDEQDYAETLEPLGWRDREQTLAVLDLAHRWSQPLAIMRALDVAGRDLLYRHGAFHEARAVHEELLAASRRFGSIPGEGEALTQVAASQIAVGELAGAVQAARRAQEVIAQLGTGHRLQFVATGLAAGLAYFLDGDWPSLAEAIAQYATSPQAARSPWGIIADAHAALCASRAGNQAAARLLLLHCAAVLEHIPPTSYAANAAMEIAAITASDLDEPEFGRRCRAQALEMLRAGVGDLVFGPLELAVAQMAAVRRDVDEAQDYFERARNRVDARGLLHVRGIVDYEQARALIRWGTTDRTHVANLLEVAAGAFRARGMLGWAGRAVEQLQCA